MWGNMLNTTAILCFAMRALWGEWREVCLRLCHAHALRPRPPRNILPPLGEAINKIAIRCSSGVGVPF